MSEPPNSANIVSVNCDGDILTLVVCALAATWIDFGNIHQYQNSDSIVPILVSLQRWSPFYWGQNRFGMLIPLLAIPFHSPFANLLVQAWLGTFAGLLAAFCICRFALGGRSPWFVAGATVNLAAVYLVPANNQFDWFATQPYAVAIVLGFSAFVILEKPGAGRWIVAVVLMLMAHWVNVTLFTILSPFAVLLWGLDRRRYHFKRLFSCLLLGAFGGWLLMHSTKHWGSTPTKLIPFREWPLAWSRLAYSTRAMLPPLVMWILLAALIVVFVLAYRTPSHVGRTQAASVALVGAGFIYWLFVGTLSWVRDNVYSVRYVDPALLFGAVAFAILAAPVFERTVGRIPALTFVTILIFAIVVYRSGRPSVAQVRRTLDEHFGLMTDEIVKTNSTVVAGNYWTVWPAVFHADLILYERNDREVVYGLTGRYENTRALWAKVPMSRLCVAAPINDPDADLYMDRTAIQFPKERRLNTIELFEQNYDSPCERTPQSEQ